MEHNHYIFLVSRWYYAFNVIFYFNFFMINKKFDNFSINNPKKNSGPKHIKRPKPSNLCNICIFFSCHIMFKVLYKFWYVFSFIHTILIYSCIRIMSCVYSYYNYFFYIIFYNRVIFKIIISIKPPQGRSYGIAPPSCS